MLLLWLLFVGCLDPVAPVSEKPPPPDILADRGRQPDPCHLTVALAQVGVMESGGNNAGPEVEGYLASTGFAKGAPWCAAFVHWCFWECGVTLEPKRSFALAANWHPKAKRIWEKNVGRGWEREVDEDFYRVSENGDIFALWYNNLGRIGHTGVIAGEDNDYFYTVEGNTGPGGEREGEGVFKRKRLRRTIYCISRWHKKLPALASARLAKYLAMT